MPLAQAPEKAFLSVVVLVAALLAVTTAQTAMIMEVQTFGNNTIVCFPLGTPFNLTIDWGDGTSRENFDKTTALCNNENFFPGVSHRYTLIGNYTISMDRNGPGPVWLTTFGTASIYYWPRFSSSRLTRVQSFGALGIQSLASAFAGTTLAEVPSILPSTVTSLAGTFASSDTNLPAISSWITTAVTDMQSTFSSNTVFNQPLAWDTSNVKKMGGMFLHAESFNRNINHFRVHNVDAMDSLFGHAYAFNQPLDQWDVSRVTSFAGIFGDARTFNQNVNIWDTSSAKRMGEAFRNALAFNQPLQNWNTTGVVDMPGMFSGAAAFNQNLSSWCVKNFIQAPSLFSQNSNLSSNNLPRWGTCPPPPPRPPVAPPKAPPIAAPKEASQVMPTVDSAAPQVRTPSAGAHLLPTMSNSVIFLMSCAIVFFARNF
jgi:hypothetical protein